MPGVISIVIWKILPPDPGAPALPPLPADALGNEPELVFVSVWPVSDTPSPFCPAVPSCPSPISTAVTASVPSGGVHVPDPVSSTRSSKYSADSGCAGVKPTNALVWLLRMPEITVSRLSTQAWTIFLSQGWNICTTLPARSVPGSTSTRMVSRWR